MTARRTTRAAALAVLPALALFALHPALAASEPIGVAAAVNPDAAGTPPQMQKRLIEVGTNMLKDEKVETGPNGQVQLLFNDGSAISIGPNSEMVLDTFVYDPAKGTGQMAVSVAKGTFRFIGGKISKENPVQIKAGSATMGIRGGVVVIQAIQNVPPNASPSAPPSSVPPSISSTATFVYGNQLSVTQGGTTQVTSVPGTAIFVPPAGPPEPPQIVTAQQMRQTNAQTTKQSSSSSSSGGGGNDSGGGSTGGGSIEAGLSSSGVSQQNSANSPSSMSTISPAPQVQQQQSSNPAPQQSSSTEQASKSVSSSQNQSQNQQATNTNQPVITQLPGRIGRFLYDNGSTAEIFSSTNTTTGNATVNPTYNQSLNSGSFRLYAANQSASTSLQATIGSTPIGTGTTLTLPINTYDSAFSLSVSNSPYGSINGSGYVSTDRDFFYYSLQSQFASTTKLVTFGGTPTTTANFKHSGYSTYTLLNGVNSVALLSSELNSTAAATSAQVSKLYSNHSNNMQPSGMTGALATNLQATISISGQGASQASMLSGMTGVFANDTAQNDVVLTGGLNGSYRANATSNLRNYTSSVSSAAAGSNGSSVFGATGEYLVLTPDSLYLDTDTEAVTRTMKIGVSSLAGTTPVVDDYFFMNGATRTSNPSIVTSPNRSSRTLQGYASGMLERAGQTDQILYTKDHLPTNVSLTTNATSNQASASFVLRGSTQDFTIEFGDVNAGLNDSVSRSSFINDSLYAARESYARTSKVDSTSVQSAQNFLASSALASVNSSFVSSGNAFCSTCTDLSWGWWLSNMQEASAGPNDRVHMGTFVTGLLPATNAIQQTGTATFRGQALGSVTSGTNRYLTLGNYLQTWNFASKTGQIYITNFDGYNFVGSASTPSNDRDFNANLTQLYGTGISGAVSASFFSDGLGNNAKYVGGEFTLTGTGYQAIGTVAASSNTTSTGFLGRFLRSDPTNSINAFTGFNNSTLRATAVSTYNNANITFTRLDQTWMKAATTEGDLYFYAVPASSSYSAGAGTVISPYGQQAGTVYYAADQSFFFAGLRDSLDNTARTVVFGGNPTPRVDFPTTGLAAYNMGQGNNPVPFANTAISFTGNANLSNVREVSPLYAAFSNNLTYAGTSSSPIRAVHTQASIGIYGQGASQQSFLVAETGNFVEEAANNDVALTGGMRGSIRYSDTDTTTRLVSNVTSADADTRNAIYGSNADHMVLTPDATVNNTVDSTIDRETALAFNQPHTNLTGSSYNFFEVANRQTTYNGTLSNPGRNDLTLNGYAGGLMEVSPLGNGTVSGTDRVLVNQSGTAADVTIQTSATNNRVSSSFALGDVLNGTSTNSYLVKMGSITGTSNGSSAFINDNIFAARDVSGATDNTFNGGAGVNGGTSVSVDQRGIMVTSTLASVSSSAIPNDVTLCSCEYLKWGWWITDIRHNTGDTINERDRVHLATWVAGVLPNVAEVPTTGTASYTGNVIGNVNNNGSRYVAIGNYTQSWNFATKGGTTTITSFDNLANITGALNSANGRDFNGSLSGTGITGQLAGSFFKGGTDPVKAAAGNFTLTGTNYQAAGTFAAQKP
ncbi:FecR domain-containing protein [Ferrovibrio sp.]|uniref:FecR domain-containing protein n=1 Tax=Ferrovibrio sp. TaxID=1917215 RepID=UPI003D14020E